MKRVALIGLGAIGKTIVRHWEEGDSTERRLIAILVRPERVHAAGQALPASVKLVSTIEDLLALKPDIVIEAAGHALARETAERTLLAGIDYYLLSVGILAEDGLRERLAAAARQSGAAVKIPVGALAGFDGLLAWRREGLESVRYTSTKPPYAWKGTPAEELVNLDAVRAPTTFFSGTAREAARLFPQNANLAAAVALAGLGFDETEVELVADPAVAGNLGVIDAKGGTGFVRVEVDGLASQENPKTSAIVGLSVLSSLENLSAAWSFV